MPATVNSIESGITSAVRNAARTLPSSTNRTAITSSAPSTRLRSHRRDRAVDELGAVVDRPRLDARRQAAVDLRELRGRALRDRAAVLADQHEDGAEHDLAAVLGGRAGAQLAAEPDLGDVADADRDAARVAHDDPAHVVEIAQLARRAHQVLLAVALDVAGAGAEVVARERVQQIAEA